MRMLSQVDIFRCFWNHFGEWIIYIHFSPQLFLRFWLYETELLLFSIRTFDYLLLNDFYICLYDRIKWLIARPITLFCIYISCIFVWYYEIYMFWWLMHMTTLNIFCQKIENLYNWMDNLWLKVQHCCKRRNCSSWVIQINLGNT